MKVRIAYLPGEEQKAETLHRFTRALLKPARVSRSDRNIPYKHIYIASEKQSDTPCKNGENMV